MLHTKLVEPEQSRPLFAREREVQTVPQITRGQFDRNVKRRSLAPRNFDNIFNAFIASPTQHCRNFGRIQPQPRDPHRKDKWQPGPMAPPFPQIPNLTKIRRLVLSLSPCLLVSLSSRDCPVTN